MQYEKEKKRRAEVIREEQRREAVIREAAIREETLTQCCFVLS